LACLCWVPFHDDQVTLAACELKSNWEGETAIRWLLRSGNHRPNQSFSGPGEFSQRLALKDFRAALAIDEPKLYVDKSGRAKGVTFYRMSTVGYTPIRLGHVTWYSSGTGSSDGVVYLRPHEAIIECWIRFKIGWVGDRVSAALTGHRAPSAIVKFEYAIDGSGRVAIRVFGSSVPSHSIYVDWRSQEDGYCMEKHCTMASFRAFLEVGECRDAPMSHVYSRTREHACLRSSSEP